MKSKGIYCNIYNKTIEKNWKDLHIYLNYLEFNSNWEMITSVISASFIGTAQLYGDNCLSLSLHFLFQLLFFHWIHDEFHTVL